jgi:hypothetical protein
MQTKSPGKPGLRFVEGWLSVAIRLGTTTTAAYRK